MLHQTITSIEENFNEEICKLKAKKNQENKDINNENKIIDNSLDLNFDIEKLKNSPSVERLQKIMEIFNSKK